MSSVTNITAYKTSDGTIFKDEAEAVQHENRKHWDYLLTNDDACYHGGLAGITDLNDLENFLERNESWIKEMMGWNNE